MHPDSLDQLFMQSGLPFSRDERFYTATVLPALLTEDRFAGLETLRSLINESASLHGTLAAECPPLPVEGGASPTNVQVLSEFDLRKALQSPKSAARFGSPMDVPPVVPDLVIYVEGRRPVLMALEAKMFLRFPRHDLESQMLLQSKVLEFLRDNLVTNAQPAIQILQVAVLPEARLQDGKYEGFPFPIVTWQGLERAFSQAQRGAYWHGVLKLVLRHWGDLVSETFSKDYESRTGREIALGVAAGADEFPYQFMGRRGGISGKGLDSDLENGGWRRKRYAVRVDLPDRDTKNWFGVEEFVALLRQRWFQGSKLLADASSLATELGWSQHQGLEEWANVLATRVQGAQGTSLLSGTSPEQREQLTGEIIALSLALGSSLGIDPFSALEGVLLDEKGTSSGAQRE